MKTEILPSAQTPAAPVVTPAPAPAKNRWVRPVRLAILFAILYVVSVGPVFNLYRTGKLSHGVMNVYRPLISHKSPMFEFSRWYLIQWVELDTQASDS